MAGALSIEQSTYMLVLRVDLASGADDEAFDSQAKFARLTMIKFTATFLLGIDAASVCHLEILWKK
jgi:hypothetical protein